MTRYNSVIELGATYRDAVSGFEGVAVNTTLFLFSCERVALSAGFEKGKSEEQIAVFDAAQLIKTKDPSKDILRAINEMNGTKVVNAPVSTGGDRPAHSAIR